MRDKLPLQSLILCLFEKYKASAVSNRLDIVYFFILKTTQNLRNSCFSYSVRVNPPLSKK